MEAQILYGVGSSILRNFTDETKIIAMSKLKDVTVDASGSDEKITAGDSIFPIASFPKDKAVKVTANSGLFDINVVAMTQGVDLTTGAVTYIEPIDFIIPSDGMVDLEHTPIADKTIINGSTAFAPVATVELVIASGNFFVDPTAKTIKFFTGAEGDAGKLVSGLHEWTSSANAQTMTSLTDSMTKPFKYIHRIPVYNDDNAIVAQAQLIVYKCKAVNAFNFDLKAQTAFAPKVELEALDPRRPDKKFWDFTIDPVAVV